MNDGTLISGFLRSVERFKDRPAIELEQEVLSYEDLFRRAAGLASTLQAAGLPPEPPLTAILADRSVSSFASVLGVLMTGRGYVPLSPGFPTNKLAVMLDKTGCDSMIVDWNGIERLDDVLSAVDRSMLVLLPDLERADEIRERWPRHRFVPSTELTSPDALRIPSIDPDAIAYVLFTSGSTGTPKGVMVRHSNVVAFLTHMLDRYRVAETDRFSQMFPAVFDLSVFDMFMAWARGAALCCPSRAQMLSPAEYVQSSRLSVWFSVPSTGLVMKKLGMLEPDAFPDLRLSLFCGEALPATLVQAWAKAAPASVIENLYGPTELTIACTLYRWDEDVSPDLCENGIVPIGDAYPDMKVLVADDSLVEVAPGGVGELLMAGPQLTPGYLTDAERTAAAFVQPPGRDEVFYRTGDRVRRSVVGRPMTYIGRHDAQVQIHGHRVELGEVEQALREASGVDESVALAWPRSDSGADGIRAFVQREGGDARAILKALRKTLPSYMVPTKVHFLPALPLNANGKFDRKALALSLDERAV